MDKRMLFKLRTILEKKHWSDYGTSLGTIVATLVATVALLQTCKQSKIQVESGRPILSYQDNTLNLYADAIELVIPFVNNGQRPAYEITSRQITIIVDTNGNKKLATDTAFTYVNPLPPHSKHDYYNTALLTGTVFYFINTVSYSDIITKKSYTDSIYSKWINNYNETKRLIVWDVTVQERTELLTFLINQSIK